MAVEIDANDVSKFPDAACGRDGNVEAADGGVAADARKRVGQRGARFVVVEAKRQIVARSVSASAGASARRYPAKAMVQT